MRIHPRLTVFIIISVLLAIPVGALGEEPKPPKLFEDSSEMQVTFSGPWRRIKKNIEDDALYPARLTYTTANGEQKTIDVEVAPRGISRRHRVCDFPPLKVHFDKDQTKGTEFRGNGSLKLVTYCDSNSKYEQYYVKEFLSYRIYNLITDLSFRVRPMTIDYRDSERDDESIRRFSFMIEDLDDVAERNDLKKLGLPQVKYKTLDATEISKLGLFQFMIGNVDYATYDGPEPLECCHNTKLIGSGDDEVPRYSIPYDFDSTGLVDAHYAAPPLVLKLRNIRQRLYRGFCFANDQLPQNIALFNKKKPEILGLFNNHPHLTDRNRKKAIKYIEGFYKIIDDPKQYEKQIIDKCRGSAL